MLGKFFIPEIIMVALVIRLEKMSVVLTVLPLLMQAPSEMEEEVEEQMEPADIGKTTESLELFGIEKEQEKVIVKKVGE